MSDSALAPAIRALSSSNLPLAEVGARVRADAALDELADGLDAGGAHQLARLAELLLLVAVASEHGDEEAALGLGAGCRIRLVLAHARDYATRRAAARL